MMVPGEVVAGDARHIPTYRVIATIRIHVMTWGSSLLVRGKASFGLE